jgi:hypothetical protein
LRKAAAQEAGSNALDKFLNELSRQAALIRLSLGVSGDC